MHFLEKLTVIGHVLIQRERAFTGTGGLVPAPQFELNVGELFEHAALQGRNRPRAAPVRAHKWLWRCAFSNRPRTISKRDNRRLRLRCEGLCASRASHSGRGQKRLRCREIALHDFDAAFTHQRVGLQAHIARFLPNFLGLAVPLARFVETRITRKKNGDVEIRVAALLGVERLQIRMPASKTPRCVRFADCAPDLQKSPPAPARALRANRPQRAPAPFSIGALAVSPIRSFTPSAMQSATASPKWSFSA